MKVNGEEIIAVESDDGLLCPSCWLQKTKDNPNDTSTDYYFTPEQGMDLVYEMCNECGCLLGGLLLFDTMD